MGCWFRPAADNDDVSSLEKRFMTPTHFLAICILLVQSVLGCGLHQACACADGSGGATASTPAGAVCPGGCRHDDAVSRDIADNPFSSFSTPHSHQDDCDCHWKCSFVPSPTVGPIGSADPLLLWCVVAPEDDRELHLASASVVGRAFWRSESSLDRCARKCAWRL